MEDQNKNNRIIQSVIAGVIVSLLGTLLSFGLGYFNDGRGYIHISKSIKIGENSYLTTLKIENNNNKTINDLSFKLKNNGEVLNVYSNYPIEINHKNKNNINYISLSNIFSGKTFDLLISSKVSFEKSDVEFMNAEEKDFKIVRKLQGDIRKREVIIIGMILSVIYGLMISISFYILKERQDKHYDKMSKEKESLKKEAQKLKEKVDRDNKSLEKNKKQIDQTVKSIRKELHKQKLVLIARLRDYSKELSFWKDTIRKIMYKTGGNKNENISEKLFKIVTKNLETFSTRKDVEFDYKTIEALDEMYHQDEIEDEE